MKLNDIIAVHEAINELLKKQMPFKTSWALAELYSKLQPHVDFRLNETKKIIQKYEHETTENGGVQFKNPQDAENCLKELRDLGEFDIDIDNIEKPTITIGEDINISVENVLALKKLVNFQLQ